MFEQFTTVILVAIVLGADSFSLAMGMGLKGVSRSYEMKFSAMVGVFHILMPLIGLTLGMAAGNFLGIWAGRLGALVLAYLGFDMIWKGYGALRPKYFKLNQAQERVEPENQFANGWLNLILLTTSVSIDALTVGFSLGTIFTIPIFYPVLVIGLTAGIMTLAGFLGGKIFNQLIGTYATMAGGIILISLAVKMFF
jgi:putative Mn2+ efflux pump MntP